MKDFERKNQRLSLCGLNCGLCPMLLGTIAAAAANGSPSCKIAKCSLEHGEIEYCYECKQYPCEKYEHIDEYDSFITHRHQRRDLEKAKSAGNGAYNLEQTEKAQIFQNCLPDTTMDVEKFLLRGGKFTGLFEIREAMNRIESNDRAFASEKERCAYAVEVFQEIADRKNIKLKLIKK